MSKSFTVNGVVYAAKPFTYNLICNLEEMGVSMTDMQNKPMSVVRAYFASCAGRGAEFAGEQIEQHLIGGGELTELMEVMSGEMDDSDFFRALSKRQADNPTEGAETQETPKAKK